MTEEFKIVPDFPNYEVSNFGRVRKVKTGKFRKIQNLYQKNKPWRQRINLKNSDTLMTITIHRLVMNTFSTNEENKPTIDHIDRNPFNNRLDNLRWATYAEQLENKGKGIKISLQELDNIFLRMKTEDINTIAEDIGIRPYIIDILLKYVHPEY